MLTYTNPSLANPVETNAFPAAPCAPYRRGMRTGGEEPEPLNVKFDPKVKMPALPDSQRDQLHNTGRDALEHVGLQVQVHELVEDVDVQRQRRERAVLMEGK